MKIKFHVNLHIGQGVQVGVVVVGLLLLNIKLDIGITQAITILAAHSFPLVGQATTPPVQHVAQVLVRQGVTFTCPLMVVVAGEWRRGRLLGRRVEPLVDIVPGRWRFAERQALGGTGASAAAPRRGRAADSLGTGEEVQSLVRLELQRGGRAALL